MFGSWIPWNPRDRSTLRAMLPIQRRYRSVLCGEDWTPLVPTRQRGVYASLWRGEGLRIWTLVNRNHEPAAGALLHVPELSGPRYYDLIAGRPIETRSEAGMAALSGEILPRGIGCFLSGTDRNLGADFQGFLRQQAGLNARAEPDATTPRRQTHLRPVTRTKLQTSVPAGMAEIPTATVELRIEMQARECGFYESMPPGEHGFAGSYRFQSGEFRRRVSLPRFAIDETLVTNAQFAAFLQATGCRPKHTEKFLQHWTDGQPPAGKEDHPVVHVDGGPRPADFATKFLLTWPGLDRCSTVGFRCVVDLAES